MRPGRDSVTYGPAGHGSTDQWPWWAGYAVAVLLELGLTAVLKALQTVFPMPPVTAPYVLLLASVGFMFGRGPAAAAFAVSFLAYLYLFKPPSGTLWPIAQTARSWAATVEFVILAAVAGYLSVLARAARLRTGRLTSDLAHSQQRYRDLVESTADWVWEVDENAIYTYSSPRVREMLGYEPNEVLGKTPFDFMPENEAADIWAKFTRAAQTATPIVQLENRLVRKDGREIVVETSGNPIIDEDGVYRGYRGIDRDITRRKQAEQATRESEEKFRSIVETTREWIWEVAPDGRHLYSNPAVEDMLGWRVDELVGSDVLGFMHEDDRERVVKTMADCTAHARGWTGLVIRWRHKSGGYRWLESNSVPVLDDKGNVLAFRGADRDITARMESEEAMRESLRRERRIAEILQGSLLTPVPERIDGFGFETVYQPAWDEAAVGGDFYDVFSISNDKVGIAVGDVSGKGLAAAAQVAMVKYFLRSRAYESDSPAVVSDHVNKALVTDASIEGFATVFFGILDCATSRLTYANGGHSPALLWREDHRRATMLESTGMAFGCDPEAEYTEQSVDLSPGDEIFLGTDGLYEVHCEGQYLGVDGLLRLYVERKLGGEGSGADIVHCISELCKHKLRDDVAVLRVYVARTSDADCGCA